MEQVNNIKKTLCFRFKTDDANTLGIIKKIENGLIVPPVKYNNKLNCVISMSKKINAVLSEINTDLLRYNKIKLLKIPKQTIIFDKKKLNLNSK